MSLAPVYLLRKDLKLLDRLASYALAEHSSTGAMTLQFSRRLAILIGIVTPSIETIRRWHELRTLTVWWPAYLDDVLLGAFLLYGSWRAGSGRPHGRAALAAAWGFMCGIAYGSLFGQLVTLGQPDPSGIAPALVVAFKALGLALGITGLVSALRQDGRTSSA